MSFAHEWRCRRRVLGPQPRTLLMGIVNVTPDSFSDGGETPAAEAAVRRARAMHADGADVVDIGGESTRPGAGLVTVEEELSRVLPVIEQLAGTDGLLLSVDTTKAAVARAALEAGADILNDVSAMTRDPEMPAVAAQYQPGVILMHCRGEPRTMQDHPCYDDVVADVFRYLEERVSALQREGLDRSCLAVDPGFGFGKTDRHNAQLLNGLPALAALGRPLVVGWSRKSTLGRWTGRAVRDRLAGSLAAVSMAVLRGADVVRVHDVPETADALRVLEQVQQEGG